MHAIHRHKLLGQSIGDAEVILWRARDATDNLTRADAPKLLINPLARQTPPVGVHAHLQRWMIENGWCPVNGMDLRHQSRVNKAGVLEEFFIRPRGIGTM